MSDFFKESDFDMYFVGDENSNWRRQNLAKYCNQLRDSRGTVVYGAIHNKDRFGWQMHEKQTEEYKRYDTHRALLINIEPIERDSAEKIAKDLADYKFDHEVGLRFREFVDRARKLRGEK